MPFHPNDPISVALKVCYGFWGGEWFNCLLIGGGILRLCPDLFIQQAWLPCLLGNASCLCCSR